MTRLWSSLLFLCLTLPALAQQGEINNSSDGFTLTPELDLEFTLDDELELNAGQQTGELTLPPGEEEVQQAEVAQGDGAVLRGLDRISGTVTDFELASGEVAQFERLMVQLGECRYPKDNPAGDAFGYLVIWPEGSTQPRFQGWMVASSPALNALDHPRYDVWLLRCKTS